MTECKQCNTNLTGIETYYVVADYKNTFCSCKCIDTFYRYDHKINLVDKTSKYVNDRKATLDNEDYLCLNSRRLEELDA